MTLSSEEEMGVRLYLAAGKEQLICYDVLEAINKSSYSTGEALNILGVCLAIYAYRSKKGDKREITVNDARQWSYRNMQKD